MSKISIGEFSKRLGFVVTSEFVATNFDVEPVEKKGNSKLYTEEQFQTVCKGISGHATAVAAKHPVQQDDDDEL